MRQKIQLILIYTLILITLLVQVSCKASSAAADNGTRGAAETGTSDEPTERAAVNAAINGSDEITLKETVAMLPVVTIAQEETTTASDTTNTMATANTTIATATAASLVSSSETATATTAKPASAKPTTAKPTTAKPTTEATTTTSTKATTTTTETTEQPANPNAGIDIYPDPTPVPVGTYSADKAQQVLVLVNQARADAGYPALTWNGTLASACDVRAKEIVINFGHTRPDGTSERTASDGLSHGENIAAGRDLDTAQVVMDAWMASEGHKNNLLGVTSPYTITAVSCYCVNGVYFWVQEFG